MRPIGGARRAIAMVITALVAADAGLASQSPAASVSSAALAEGDTVYPVGPQPLWTTVADGAWMSGNAEPTCRLDWRSRAVFAEPSGEIYVAGVSSASHRFFILKLDAEGGLLWQRTFSTNEATAHSLRFFHRSSGEPRVGFARPVHRGYSVTALSSEGVEAWTSTLLSENESHPYFARAAALSDDGHVYVVGPEGFGGGFVARHSGAGNPDWVTRESGFGTASLALAGNSGVVVVGFGFDDPVIAKYDPQGNRSWKRDLVDPEDRRISAADFLVGTGGEIFLAGASCKGSLCRPALAALDSTGEWLWIRLPEVLPGTDEGFRFIAIGGGKVHALRERGEGSTHFLDVDSYTEDGQALGTQTLGPASSLTSAAPRVDSLGWLRFTGVIRSQDGQGVLLASLSPAGTLTAANFRPEGFTSDGGCDLAEGPGGRMIIVGRSARYGDEDLLIGSFEPNGAPLWQRREPDLESPNDTPSPRIGQARKSPAAHQAADGSYWVVGKSRRGQTNRAQPMGWHFSPTGDLLGSVSPFGQTGYNQWATRAVPRPDSGMAMSGVASSGTGLPFVASFAADGSETMRLVDVKAENGGTEALFRSANGELLGVEHSRSTGDFSTELVRISASGELLERIQFAPPSMGAYDAVIDEDETVWAAGMIFGAGVPGMDCAIAGVSVASGLHWSHTFGDTETAAYCSAIDARGGRVVVGATILDNAVIKSFHRDGDLEWVVDDLVEAGEGWRIVDELALDELGNLYLSGTTDASYRHRLAKLSPAGTPLWDLPDELLGGHALSFALGAGGAAFVLEEPALPGPLRLYRLDATGEVAWMTSLTEPYETVVATSDGHLILTGSSFQQHSYDLVVSVFDVADFLFAGGFESGDMTSWYVENP